MTKDIISHEDRLNILELCARYQHFFDAGEAEEWASTFASDGTFDGPAGTAKGQNELQQFCRDTLSKFPIALHFTDHHIFERKKGIVVHKCILSVQVPTDKGAQIGLFRYCDELVKIEGEWKFKSRTVTDP